MVGPSKLSRLVGLLGAGALAVTGLLVAAPAQADTAPPNPADPVTVSADALPTAQINGVVWNQQVAGDRVYVGGEFTRARPPGAAAGTSEVVRNNMMAYSLSTGALNTSFAPDFNAEVRDLALTPDGTKLVAVGAFTSINGEARYRVAAFDAATGALISSFRPTVNSTVSAVAVTNTTVFIGGNFSSANGTARTKVAALRLDNGATLPLSADLVDGSVQAITVAPDGGSIVIGGSFTSVDGSSNPGYGLARLDSTTGDMMPLPVNTQIRNGGDESAILSLETDGDMFYGTGYHFGGGGNVEGTFAADWATGSEVWVEDCHGDTYSSYPMGDVVYSASHKHYCGNSGGFPQTSPWTVYRATALTKAATRINTADIYGYPDHDGEPSPTILNWYPTINTGTYTGKSQGPWTVTTSGKYVLYGGEFTQVNNTGQQGLVRFTTIDQAPLKQGPRLQGTNWPLSVSSVSSGEVRIAWNTNFDRDNETLTYKLYRESANNPPIYTETVSTTFWNVKTLRFKDTGLTPGSSVRYRVYATDPNGNTVGSSWVTVTVSDAVLSPYAGKVLDDGATNFWRLDEPAGSTSVADWAGNADMVSQAGVTRGVAGALGSTDSDLASSFNGTGTGLAATQTAIAGPQTFALEGWFKTTTTAGGKMFGFGSANTGNSGSYDRHIYMDTQGRVLFGVYPGTSRTLSTTTRYNDGQWHYVVGSLGPDGMKLFVDGRRVAQRTDTTSAQAYSGYWRIGGDNSWSGAPYFNGTIDDVAVYPAPLTTAQVDAHWVAAGRTSTAPPAPADTYGAAVYNAQPDLFWRLSETTGSVATDASVLNNTGTLSGGYTRLQAGALVGQSTNYSVRLNGSTGLLASTAQFSDPSVYSEELWFKTSTTNGGKLIGFGDAATGLSSNYDRHVYMETDGRLTFGVWTGVANTITTTAAYNNNAWHHLVATQGPDGMKLYVDGVLRGTNPQTDQQAYTGYWRVGGDNTWGPQPWFAGNVDEVAVYSSVLTPTQVAQHYALGSGQPAPNVPPTASFTATTTDLSVQVDGTGSSDPDGTLASYVWNWGDSTPNGSGSTASHTYTADGTYTVTLTVTDNRGGTATTTRTVQVAAPPPNQPPVAAFTTAVNVLAVQVDGSGSTDGDGSIASYAWSWGDGTPGSTGATASHTYAGTGTYSVTLTVTDDDGATTSLSKDVSVTAPPPNQPPAAAFTASANLLTANVDGTGSADSDGTITSYAWSWGDSTAGSTGATASHTYAAAGTYTVTLTVTDDDGATGTVTHDVTVTAPPPGTPFATDTFTRTVTGGWGTATTGGPWTTVGTASRLSVTGGRGVLTDPVGGTVGAYLGSVVQTSTDLTATLSTDRLSTGTSYATLQGRRVGNDAYGARVRLGSDGSIQVHATREVAGTTTALGGGAVTGLTFAANDQLLVRTQVEGVSPTTVRVKVWKAGTTEPTDWRATVTDSSASLQTGGGVGVTVYHGGTSGNPAVAFSWDDLSAKVVGAVPPPNVAPAAAFTAGTSGLTANVDGTGSSDSDGTVASYAWSWGDGTPNGSGATASHTYGAAGTYTVTLTVTDDDGATASTTQDVTVSVTPPVDDAFARDDFARTVSNGWGNALLGGAWTTSGTASRLSVAGGRGVLTDPVGGTVGAYLASVSQTNADVTATLSTDRLSTGTSFATLQGRRVGNDAYGARVRLGADGSIQVHATREVAGTTTAMGGGVVTGLTFAANDQLLVRTQVQGVSPTTVRVKVWKAGTAEPTDWRAAVTDSSASLQVGGGIGVSVYHGGTTGNPAVAFSWDDLVARPVQ